MTEQEFMELVLKKLPPNSKMVKIENGGNPYFRVGELNIVKAAKLFKDLIK